MNTIDELNEMSLKIREKRDGRKDGRFSFYLDCTVQIQALTEAIDSLKCDKLARVREYLEGLKTAYLAKERIDASDKRCYDLASDCFDAVLEFSYQLDKEQA